MNKRPGHVVVTTEVAVCSFCGRPRTLRSEQHQLGALVRTIVTCETCHRTLSSFISVADAEPAASRQTAIEPQLEQKAPTAEPPAPTAERQIKTQRAKPAAKPAVKSGAQRKPAVGAAAKATASKSRTPKKTR